MCGNDGDIVDGHDNSNDDSNNDDANANDTDNTDTHDMYTQTWRATTEVDANGTRMRQRGARY